METEKVKQQEIQVSEDSLANKKNFSDMMLDKIEEMGELNRIHFPDNYSPQNAIASAWLMIQDMKTKINGVEFPVLTACTKRSIANSVLDLVIQGLSLSKRQAYLIPYKQELTLQRSYFGTVSVAKRFDGIKEVFAQCVYPSESFRYGYDECGNTVIEKHVPLPIDKIGTEEFIGVYAVVVKEDGSKRTEIMSRQQVINAWGMGKGYGKSKAHREFPDQMAKKTVINRACKMSVNTSNDSDLLIGAFNRTTENEYKENGVKDVTVEQPKLEANTEVLEMPEKTETYEELDAVEPEEVESSGPDDEEMKEIHQMEMAEAEEKPGWMK